MRSYLVNMISEKYCFNYFLTGTLQLPSDGSKEAAQWTGPQASPFQCTGLLVVSKEVF